MTQIAAQVSLYPLGPAHLGPAIREALDVFRAHGLDVRPGEMSTVIGGTDADVFEAMRRAFTTIAEHSPVVMTVTVSNACPTSATRSSADSCEGQLPCRF
jgi:uncharacterized protein YqgV (UPF0045/DUF77 family)